MRAVQIEQFGSPEFVASAVEVDAAARPGAGEVQIAMKVMPINPSDLALIEGRYGRRPDLPYIPGSEGAGVVSHVGPGVEGIDVGDVAVPLISGLWRARLNCPASEVLRLPPDTDLEQAALLKLNPAAADVMLRDQVALAPGDWVVQNAANSTVGRYIVQLAARRGLKTANVVRRQDVVEVLQADGADLILFDDGLNEHLAEEFLEHSGGVPARLALDAVGGASANHLAGCLADGAVLVNYGMLSGRHCEIDSHHLVYRGLNLRGFWLQDWLGRTSAEDIRALYTHLGKLIAAGEIHGLIEARHDLDRVQEALAEAAMTSRNGKVVLTA